MGSRSTIAGKLMAIRSTAVVLLDNLTTTSGDVIITASTSSTSLPTASLLSTCYSNNKTNGGAHCFPGTDTRVFLTLLLTLFILVSLFGNALLCGIVYRRSAMRSGINLLLANVAMTDFLMSIFHFPMALVVLNTKRWPFGDGMCKLNGFMFALLNAEKVVALLIISIDRYFIIVKRKDTLTSSKAKISIVGSWLFSLFVAILPVLGWGRYDYFHGCIQCIVQDRPGFEVAFLSRSYIIFATTTIVFIPGVVMAFIYYRIFRTVRRNGFRVQNHPPVTPTAMHKKGKYFIDYSYKTRTSTTILLLSIFFLTCVLPLAIANVSIASNGGFHNIMAMETYLGLLVFSYCHSPCSPVLYYWRIKKFRESLVDWWSQMLIIPHCVPFSVRRERRIRPHVLYQVENQVDGKIAVIS